MAAEFEALETPRIKVSPLLVTPADLPFPGMPQEGAKTQDIQEQVRQADGMLIASPEFQGSHSAWLKLVIEHLGYPSVLEGKPVALMGVAAGHIGAVKTLEHLRGILSHIGAFVLPFALSVSNAYQVFDEESQIKNPKLREQFQIEAKSFGEFLGRFQPIGS